MSDSSSRKGQNETRRSNTRRVSSFVDTSQQSRDLQKRVGSRIREIREQKGLTQEELARAAAIDRSYLAQIEQGKRRISLDVAYRIAKNLDCSIDSLMDHRLGKK